MFEDHNNQSIVTSISSGANEEIEKNLVGTNIKWNRKYDIGKINQE